MPHKLSGFETGGGQVTAGSHGGTTHLQMGKLALDGTRRRAVEPEIVRVAAAPHRRTVLRFIPDFPVPDVEVETVCPPFIVVPDHPQGDGGPFVGSGGWVGKSLDGGVFDALAQAVNNLRPRRPHGLDIFVRQPEIITLRPPGIGVEIRKHHVDIDHIRIGPMAIVQSDKGDAEFALRLGKIQQATRGQRPFVHSVQGANQPVGAGKIKLQNHRLLGTG